MKERKWDRKGKGETGRGSRAEERRKSRVESGREEVMGEGEVKKCVSHWKGGRGRREAGEIVCYPLQGRKRRKKRR